MDINTRTKVFVDTDVGQDPDDAIALLFLCARADVDLLAVTVWPGDEDQVAFVRFIMDQCGKSHVRIGAPPGRSALGTQSVSGCHVDLVDKYGAKRRLQADDDPASLAERVFADNPEAKLLTIGPLGNLESILQRPGVSIGESVSMGCYYGAPGTPYSLKEYNFNTCLPASNSFVTTDRIARRLFVSKNVTHQVLYDDELHEHMRAAGASSRGHALIAELMDLHRHPNKKLHDPLAAATMLDEGIVEWLEGRPFESGKRWGFVAEPGTGIFVATSVDIPRFRTVFLSPHAGE